VLIRGSKPVDSALPGDFKSRYSRTGAVFILVVVCMLVLAALGVGMLTVAWGARRNAIMLKSEASAMLAAEAGYEKAVYEMSKQPDMLNALEAGASGTAGALSFADSRCNYQISLYTFLGSRPIYRVLSNGYSGAFCRTVDVYVVQAISGWDMGMCRVADGTGTGIDFTEPVYFADGEIIDVPIHINNLKDSPDYRDIYITGSPQFKQLVSMGEPRYTSGGTDKYASVMGLFEQGIYFSQGDCKITDAAAVQSKVDRFVESTKGEFKFEPAATTDLGWLPGAQLEFFVEGGVGKVRITNDCRVRGFMQDSDSKTSDYRIKPGSDGKTYEKYYIYAYHVAPDVGGAPVTYPIDQTYVTQSYGEYESEPGGQIFVEGNVIIGGNNASHGGDDQVIKGDVMVVATGNIWIADSVIVDGPHQADGRPSPDNPNVLGLMAQGVIKVVDPGMSGYPAGGTNGYPGRPDPNDPMSVPAGYIYAPVAHPVAGGATYERYLPATVVEAAITVGGGGWGAENVIDSSLTYGGRKQSAPSVVQDYLYLRGTLVEAIRGVVGRINRDGYLKRYFSDERLLEGILPADIWLRGKYVPAPAGWHDYRSGG